MAEHKAHLPSSVRLDQLEAELEGAGRLLEQLHAYEDRLERLERQPAGQQLEAQADPGLEQLRSDLAATRSELADLAGRVNSLGRHVVGIAQRAGYELTARPAPPAD